MTTLPTGKIWPDAPIGRIEKVFGPTGTEKASVGCYVVFVAAVVPIPLGMLAFGTCAALYPSLDDAAFGVWWLALLAWLVLCLLTLRYGLHSLECRLLLGERGLAQWTPWRTDIVLWDDLGGDWQHVPQPPDEGGPLVVVLVHRSGVQIRITDFYADHQQAALRVLEMLGERKPATKATEVQRSEAIKPAARNVSEPRAE